MPPKGCGRRGFLSTGEVLHAHVLSLHRGFSENEMAELTPHFMADITLYPSDRGGRKSPIVGDWFGCPCKFHESDFSAWDCRILTGGTRFSPGETKRFGIAFLTPEAAPMFRKVRKFFLWEGKIIGEARVAGKRSLTENIIQILQHRRASLYDAELAGEVIAADARFNIFITEHVKGSGAGEERWTQLLDRLEGLCVECEIAIEDFIAGGSNEQLRTSLTSWRDGLNALR
jgi:hypothetical protein